MKNNKINLLFTLFLLAQSKSLYAYSLEFCTSLSNVSADAYVTQDWLRVIDVEKDFESKCREFVSPQEMSRHLYTISDAYVQLRQWSNLLETSNRCLSLANVAECHFAKGKALLNLGKFSEGRSSLRAARDLAKVSISRIRNGSTDSTKPTYRTQEFYRTMVSAASEYLGEEESVSPYVNKPIEISSSGTGILLNDAGQILTNAHVIDGCKKIAVSTTYRTINGVKVLVSSQTDDLAVLSIPTVDAQAWLGDALIRSAQMARFRHLIPEKLGEPIVVVGFPLPGLLASGANISFGNISALAGIGNDQSKLQISAPVQPGNSGGPVMDRSGFVVGVVVQKLNALKVAKSTGDIPQNINFAIKGEVAQRYLRNNKVVFITDARIEEISSTELARAGVESVVMVTCQQ
jgi:S1-C subfamily serine protease